MWSNPKSPADVVEVLRKKTPPYCPNPSCRFHAYSNSERAFYIRFGKRRIRRFPYLVFRYKCRACEKVFTSSFFELSYRDKLNDAYEEIEYLVNHGLSECEIAKFLNCSEFTVRRKLSKLARQALLRMSLDLKSIRIREPVAFDGIENFSFSQFDPNNINHAIGKESFYLYDFNFAPLNRKGRMSPRQVRKKLALEKTFGAYPRNAIESSAKKIFERLLEKSDGNLHLHSDFHFAYRRALARMKGSERIAHSITPGKVARNYRNRLFPINHMDMLTRHETASFRRETIAFSKHSIAMIERFILYAGSKNYMRSIFKKPHKSDPRIHLESPAQRLRLTKKILSFRDMYRVRITKTQVKMNEDWERFFYRIDPHSRRPILEYTGV